jgi:hypothetical protein
MASMRFVFFIICASIAMHGVASWPVFSESSSVTDMFDGDLHFVAGVAQRVDTPPLYEPSKVLGQRSPDPPYVFPGPPMEIPYLKDSRDAIIPLPQGFKILFVDDYFVNLNMSVGVQFVHHQFKFHRQLFNETRLGFGGRPGGIVYDTTLKRHAFYVSCVRKTSDGLYSFYPFTAAICVSFSRDNGATWNQMARISIPFFDKGNPKEDVIREKFTVRFRSDASYDSRYIMGAVSSKMVIRAGIDRMSWGPFRIFFSGDGFHYREGPVLGKTKDATSFTWDPWARRWIFYLKDNFNHWIRIVRFHSVRDLNAVGWPDYVDRCTENSSTSTATQEIFGRCDAPESSRGALFLAVHDKDPPYTPDSSETTARATDMYEFDSEMYENSVRVGVRHIHTGGNHWPKIIHPYLAFSRDGFHYSTAGVVAIPYRNYSKAYFCVATFLVREFDMTFFCTVTDTSGADYLFSILESSRKGISTPFNTSIPITLVFEYRLRLDGFVGATFTNGENVDSLVTRWMQLQASPNVIVLNAECGRTGFLQAYIQQYGDQGFISIGKVQRYSSNIKIRMSVNPADFTTKIIRMRFDGRDCELFSIFIE